MINRVLKLVLLTALLAGASACSSLFGKEGYFRDRGDDYLKADSLPPVKVPEEMQAASMDPLYVIPTEVEGDNEYDEVEGKFEIPRPQPLAANRLSEKVKIQRLGENRWILIHTPPSEAWPRVRNFLTQTGLQVAFTDATNGLIETTWLQFKNDPDNRDRYRLRIEQGVQPESTEIHVLHMSVNKDIAIKGTAKWPQTSANPERESWMIDELAATLASETGNSTASLLAQTIGGGAKVELLTHGHTEPMLRMELDLARAWATLGYAVQREGFTLWDKDRTAGVYYVNFIQPDPEDDGEGFLSGWFGGDDDNGKSSPYALQDILAQVQLEDTAENRRLFSAVLQRPKGEALQEVPGYLVFVRHVDRDVEVRIRDGYARKLSKRQARSLLKIIRRNLI